MQTVCLSIYHIAEEPTSDDEAISHNLGLFAALFAVCFHPKYHIHRITRCFLFHSHLIYLLHHSTHNTARIRLGKGHVFIYNWMLLLKVHKTGNAISDDSRRDKTEIQFPFDCQRRKAFGKHAQLISTCACVCTDWTKPDKHPSFFSALWDYST